MKKPSFNAEPNLVNLPMSASFLSLRLSIQCCCAFFSVITCTAATLALPDTTILGLTHSFGHYAPFGPATLIRDAAGQFTQPGFSAMLTGSETVIMRFEAPVGHKFVIHAAPSGFDSISLRLGGRWWGGSSDGMQSPTATSFAFENLVGAAPVRTSSSDILGSGGRLISFSDTFAVLPGLEFTAVELRATYAFSIASPSILNYVPDLFTFECQASSFSQMLGNGTLMTMEPVPEPTTLALIVIGATALLQHRLKQAVNWQRKR